MNSTFKIYSMSADINDAELGKFISESFKEDERININSLMKYKTRILIISLDGVPRLPKSRSSFQLSEGRVKEGSSTRKFLVLPTGNKQIVHLILFFVSKYVLSPILLS